MTNHQGFTHAVPRQQGFSLIELMVSMAIGLAIIATVGYVFLGAKMSFNTTEVLSGMQETARYAFEYMGKDIRMAGFSGGPANESTPTNIVNAPPTSGGDAWDGNMRDLFGTLDATRPGPLAGYEQGGTFPVGITAKSGTDAIMVVRANGDREFEVSSHSAATDTFTLGSVDCADATPGAAQLYVASDYTHAAVFQVASAGACSAGAMTVGYAAGTSNPSPGNATGGLGPFNGDIKALRLYPLQAATYYIKNDASGEPTLYRQELGVSGTQAIVSDIDIVRGVSDMQILYGVDTDAVSDQSANDYWNATEVSDGSNGTNSISGATTVVDRWKRVVSVRITLTLTSRQDTRVSTTGGALTRSFTNTIAVRNRLL